MPGMVVTIAQAEVLGTASSDSGGPDAREEALRSLLRGVASGDARAFEAFYARTRNDVCRVLVPIVGQGPELDDCVQEVFLQLLSASRSFRGEAKVSTFLHRICANVGISALRRRTRRREDLVEEPPDAIAAHADPERTAQTRQAAVLLERALDALSPEKRVVFVYHELLGMFPEEIGEAMAVPANTVRSRLNRAREAFTTAVARLLRPDKGAAHG